MQLSTICLGWWVLFAFDFSFDSSVLFYSVGYGISFALCTFSVINALKTGPIAISTLIVQISGLAVSVWGLIFWDSPLTPFVIIGFILVVISMSFCLSKSGKEENGFSLKWLFFALLSFVSNAACGIIQRTQQIMFDGKYGNMMMSFAMLFAVAVGVVLYFKSDKTDTKVMVKTSWYYPALSGSFNVVFNLLIMLMATTALSPSLIYPAISLGGITITTLFSTIYFKERLSRKQWLGLLIGAVAVALLSV